MPFLADRTYPLELRAEVMGKQPLPSRQDDQKLRADRLIMTTTRAGPSEEELVIRLPFDYRPVTIEATEDALLEAPARALSLGAWQDSEGADEGTLDGVVERVPAGAPTKVVLAAAPGETTSR